MAFREVAVTEIREVLRAWLSGAGLRQVAARSRVDRKTARQTVNHQVDLGTHGNAQPRLNPQHAQLRASRPTRCRLA